MTMEASGDPTQVAVAVTRYRVRELSPAGRTVHKAILHARATTVHTSDLTALPVASGADLSAALPGPT
jgi:hypothetical protein